MTRISEQLPHSCWTVVRICFLQAEHSVSTGSSLKSVIAHGRRCIWLLRGELVACARTMVFDYSNDGQNSGFTEPSQIQGMLCLQFIQPRRQMFHKPLVWLVVLSYVDALDIEVRMVTLVPI